MNNLFVVESPLQLLNAIEAKHFFHDTSSILVVRYTKNGYGNRQINNLLELTKWDKVLGFKYSGKADFLKSLFVIKKLRSNNNFTNIFLGDYRNHWMKLFIANLTYDNVYLLDDGAGTLFLQKSLSPDIISRGKQASIIKKLLLNSLSLKDYLKGDDILHLFTMFDLTSHQGQKVIKNRFDFLKSLIKDGIAWEEDKIFFLGSNLSEMKIVSQEFYVKFIGIIREHYKNMEMVYIPHRGEDVSKLRDIKDKYKICIKKFDHIIEVAFVLENIKPLHIASFYSVALYTLRQIYPDTRIDAILLPDAELDFQYRQNIKTVYGYYKNYMNVLEIN